ncbi:Rdx family-domain-containing protein [Gaertneriomyces semiglobifer]|nr:Rdx family-domain-containing protein [Gaertneriomyces semiglobifer]
MSHYPRLEIHYCPLCRWMLRAAWVGQELLTTFTDPKYAGSSDTTCLLGEIALVPSGKGIFIVNLITKNEEGTGDITVKCVWDRKVDGGFPDLKVLKQRVRDIIAPAVGLGHSDKKDHKAVDSTGLSTEQSMSKDQQCGPGGCD